MSSKSDGKLSVAVRSTGSAAPPKLHAVLASPAVA
jgi:hypothetical protein